LVVVNPEEVKVVIEPLETDGVEVEMPPEIVESEGDMVVIEPLRVVKCPPDEKVDGA
jgi:hypothetical protein